MFILLIFCNVASHPLPQGVGKLKMGLILCQLYACLFRYIVYALRKHFHVAHLVLLRLTLFLF